MKELQKVYAEDYNAMAKDRRRNVWQRTAGELRRRWVAKRASNFSTEY